LSEIAISLKNVSKSFKISKGKERSIYHLIFSSKNVGYEKLQALDGISFDVPKGEMLGILGRNGSGKSTLLTIIARIFKPNTGTVITNGKVTPLLGIGAGFNYELNAKENIVLYGLLLGFSKKDIESRIDKILEFAELEKFADTKLKHFSSGMYARLAFSTALQVEPDILLVDEILSVGDLFFRQKSYEEFIKFKNSKRTIVFVSHDINAIKQLCDKTLVIEKGKIIFHGDTEEAIQRYKNVMNLSQKN